MPNLQERKIGSKEKEEISEEEEEESSLPELINRAQEADSMCEDSDDDDTQDSLPSLWMHKQDDASCESSESETSTTKNITPRWIMAGRWTPAVKDKESAMVKEGKNEMKRRNEELHGEEMVDEPRSRTRKGSTLFGESPNGSIVKWHEQILRANKETTHAGYEDDIARENWIVVGRRAKPKVTKPIKIHNQPEGKKSIVNQKPTNSSQTIPPWSCTPKLLEALLQR